MKTFKAAAHDAASLHIQCCGMLSTLCFCTQPLCTSKTCALQTAIPQACSGLKPRRASAYNCAAAGAFLQALGCLLVCNACVRLLVLQQLMGMQVFVQSACCCWISPSGLLSVQAFGWMLATLPLLCHLRGWGLFLLFAVASVATSVRCWHGNVYAMLCNTAGARM
jgi:hypothetical protein